MKDDRLLVAVEDSYATSIGRAVYIFASLEWNAVGCCDRMKPDYARRLGKKTANQIAEDLLKYAKRLMDPSLRSDCMALAEEFQSLVCRRNDLLHAIPATVGGGAQRLTRYGRAWTPEDIDDLADTFTACGQGLNHMMHHRLPEHCT